MFEPLFNKIPGFNFIKKRLQHRCFPVNIVNCLRTAFLRNTSGGCFWNQRCFKFSALFVMMLFVLLFIFRWVGPVKRAGSPRWDDFYPTFTWNLLSQLNQKVCYVAGKKLFDQVVFTIRWRKATWKHVTLQSSKFRYFQVEIEKKQFASKVNIGKPIDSHLFKMYCLTCLVFSCVYCFS